MMALVRKNSQHKITITDVTNKGFGVGKVDGFTIFAEGALPGEEIIVHIVKVKPSYAYGKILKILTPSVNRIKSPCPVSDKCGGCQWLFCNYGATLEFKTKTVSEAIKRIGQIQDPPVTDCIGMENPLRYRNKAVFPVVPYPTEGGFAIGMYAPRSHRLTPVTDCLLQHEAHIEILDTLQKRMMSYKISAYDEKTGRGLMRFIVIRTSFSTGEVMVVLVINGKKLPMEKELAESFQALGVATILVNENTASGNTIFGNSFRTLTGSGFITESLDSVLYRISPRSFFQVNPVQAKLLYDIAIKQADLDRAKLVLDAHVGAGGVLLYAAKKMAQSNTRFVGVDIVQEAIDDAKHNAALNGVANADFICGAAEDEVANIMKTRPPDTIFLDPPRKGCGKPLLNAIISAAVKQVVYISCDPSTLARDLKLLHEGGYKLVEAQPVDMFPFTGKVEVTCRLVHNG